MGTTKTYFYCHRFASKAPIWQTHIVLLGIRYKELLEFDQLGARIGRGGQDEEFKERLHEMFRVRNPIIVDSLGIWGGITCYSV